MAATKVQATWRGAVVRRGKKVASAISKSGLSGGMPSGLVKVQARVRGNAARQAMQVASTPFRAATATATALVTKAVPIPTKTASRSTDQHRSAKCSVPKGDGKRHEAEMRAQMAAFLYPEREEATAREQALQTLELALAKRVPSKWAVPPAPSRSRWAPIEPATASAASAAATPRSPTCSQASSASSSLGQLAGKIGRLGKAALSPLRSGSESARHSARDSARDSARAFEEESSARHPIEESSALIRAATRIQAKVRGVEARKHLRDESATAAAASAAASAAATSAAATGSGAATPLTWLRRAGMLGAAVSLAAAAAMGLYVASIVLPRLSGLLLRLVWGLVFYAVLLLLLVLAWVRLPFWLGALASFLITWLPLHGYPLGFETLSVSPRLTLRPLAIHLDVDGTNFYMGNPPKIRCRSKHLVTVKTVHVSAWMTLDGLWRQAVHGEPMDAPLVFHFPSLVLSGVFFGMMYGQVSTGPRKCLSELSSKSASNRPRNCFRSALGAAAD